MIDETTGQSWENPNAAAAEPQAAGAGYCQDCGKPLTPETIRTVGNAVFCEPCLQMRLNPGAVPPPPAAAPGFSAPVPPTTSTPSPSVAGWLGLLPGAGAMYNGQYAKGFAHLIIFVVLANLGDHNNGFGALCFGWVVYMVFDAIATARARRDGLPLPDPLHLNNVGERMASGRWHTHPAPPPPPSNPASANWQPVPPTAQANWAGYVPPTAFGGAAVPPVSPYQSAVENAQAAVNQAQAHVNDVRNYAGYSQPGKYPPPPSYSQPGVDPNNAWTAHSAVPGTQFPDPAPTSKRFPVAALILIGFGLFFLLSNVFPSVHIGTNATTALVLGVVAAVMFYRRYTTAEQFRAATGSHNPAFLLNLLRWPIILAVLSVLFILQALDIKTIGQTWPILLIVIGLMTLADRMGLADKAAADANWTNVPVAPVTTTSIVPVETLPVAPAQDHNTETGGAR